MVPENIHTPPWKGSDFPGGRGGGHHRELFLEGSRDAQESNKEKTKIYHDNLFAKILNMTKVKEPLNLWINGHNEYILSVPWRDLSRENVPYGLLLSNAFGIPLNSSGYPFKKNCHPFERLGLDPFGKSCHPFEWLGVSI